VYAICYGRAATYFHCFDQINYMFFNTPITGDKLPDKTLCLTYDDGPNETKSLGCRPRTQETAQYLHEQGVEATFFVIGERARRSPDICLALRDMGHLIANHSECHEDLLDLTSTRGDPVMAVLSTDIFIRNLCPYDTTYFRPPYGRWRFEGTWASPVLRSLNQESSLARCVGPVLWDIDGYDWVSWRDRTPVVDCARAYLHLIERHRRGIVLMHDSSWDEFHQSGNQALKVAQIIIPELKARGYRFIRLDQVPQVASASLVSRRVAIMAPSKVHYLTVEPGSAGTLRANGTEIADSQEFGLVKVGEERIALRASNGLFVSLEYIDTGTVAANAESIGSAEVFTPIDLGDSRVAFRAGNGGSFLSTGYASRGEVKVNSQSVNENEKFSFIYLSLFMVSLRDRIIDAICCRLGTSMPEMLAQDGTMDLWESIAMVVA
jgi:peptidoglycan/xylan/chitin deacetylase (PgdA/CDA1 family)